MFRLFRVPKSGPVTTLTLMDSGLATPDQNPPSQSALRWRALPGEQDHKLTTQARQWLRSLATRDRPLALCSMYPRLANRLATTWEDPVQTEAIFDELMIDHRGGRLGFAPLVASELMRLHRLHEKRCESNGNS